MNLSLKGFHGPTIHENGTNQQRKLSAFICQEPVYVGCSRPERKPTKPFHSKLLVYFAFLEKLTGGCSPWSSSLSGGMGMHLRLSFLLSRLFCNCSWKLLLNFPRVTPVK
ncbi:hypothetical protein TNIN_71801 [Trichonephila inaurata madagascariensis]|uniref:Uncharacterized protein n=1 Tax=Trichonephila inaurata madagascariensis TaxID=2747483 RepID=A0A8X6Y6U5_9ARAC|nr:hypothetical protein TNIN_71801 [Trichonephila inaurata madagascariensis]